MHSPATLLLALTVALAGCGDLESGAEVNNGANNGANNGPTNNGEASDCTRACRKITDCLRMECEQNIFPPGSCEPACEDQGFAADVLATECGELNQSLLVQVCGDPDVAEVCNCPSFASNVGEPCETADDCMADALQVACIAEVSPQTGEETGFPGGYCIAVGCFNDLECGNTGVCVQIDNQGNTLCLRRCAPGSSGTCREGYLCSDLSGDNTVGGCVPACATDADCGEGGTCVPETGECR